jgi:hypothetical protein
MGYVAVEVYPGRSGGDTVDYDNWMQRLGNGDDKRKLQIPLYTDLFKGVEMTG